LAINLFFWMGIFSMIGSWIVLGGFYFYMWFLDLIGGVGMVLTFLVLT